MNPGNAIHAELTRFQRTLENLKRESLEPDFNQYAVTHYVTMAAALNARLVVLAESLPR